MFDSNKGTALVITLVYLIVVTIICTAVLGFSSAHYRLMSYRTDRMQNLYYAEGGLYMGLIGARDNVYIQPGEDKKVVVNPDTDNPNKLESIRSFTIEY